MLKPTLLLSLISLAVSAGMSLSARPPTVDPTYGVPPAHLHAPAHVATPAQWIWVSKTQGDQTVSARATVTLSAAPRTAALFVTGDDAATAFINGHKVVTTSPVENGWKQVHRVDAAPFLHAGLNVLAVQGVNKGGGGAGLLARLDINGKPVLQSGPAWKVLEATAPPTGWAGAAFNDSRWQRAAAIAPVGQGPWSTALANWPGTDAETWYLAHLTVQPIAIQTLSGQASRTTIRSVPQGAAPASLRVDFGKEDRRAASAARHTGNRAARDNWGERR